MARVSQLHGAARAGNLAQLEALLACGAHAGDINAMDQHQRTPLHLAAFFGHAQVAERLLELDANVHAEAMDGFLAVHFAAQGGHLEVLKRIVRKIREKKGVAAVATHVNRVVKKGKKSPLHLAALKGHPACALYLVRKGAKADLKTAQGQTAFDLCKSDEVRQALSGEAGAADAAAAALAAPAVDGAELEPPAKRRATANGHTSSAPSDPGAAAAPAAAEVVASSPMSGLPLVPREDLAARPGTPVFGPFALGSVELCAAETERLYPAGISALADVHWKIENTGALALPNGPVWGIVSRELRRSGEERRLRLTVQQSDYKHLLYTCLSEEGRVLPSVARCNACGLTLLAETADAYLVLERRPPPAGEQGESAWRTTPAGCTLDSLDLGGSLGKAGQGGIHGVDPSVLAAARLLALLEEDEVSPRGHRHELVFGVRLKASAAEVHQACKTSPAQDGSLVFVKVIGNQAGPEAVEPAVEFPVVGLEELIAEGSGGCSCDSVARRALLALRELRQAAGPAPGEAPGGAGG